MVVICYGYFTTIVIPALSEQSAVPLESFQVRYRASSEDAVVSLDKVPDTSAVLAETLALLFTVAAATGSPLMMQLFAAEDMSGASIAALAIDNILFIVILPFMLAGKIIPYRKWEYNAKCGLLLYGIYGMGYVFTSGNIPPSMYSHFTYVFGNGLCRTR